MKHLFFFLVVINISFSQEVQKVTDACNGVTTVTHEDKIYNTVAIGSHCWLKENLDVGVMIDSLQNSSDNGVIEKYCYGNNPSNCTLYGALYQWDEAMQYTITQGTQGICPIGWHIPTESEFDTLKKAVGDDGNSLKALGQGSGAGAGTNTSGFSTLMAGFRGINGGFDFLGYNASFWSSLVINANNASNLYLDGYDSSIYRGYNTKGYGFSVRCLKD